MYYIKERNKSKNNNNTLLTRHAVIKLFLDAERDTALEEPMAIDTDNDIESLVQEATDTICSGEYDLGHTYQSMVTIRLTLRKVELLSLLLHGANVS